MKNFKIATIDLIQNQVPTLQPYCTYLLSITDACVVGKTLKVCFTFEDYETRERSYLLQYFEIGSKDYVDLINNVYIPDGDDVIAVNLSDFFCYSAKCPGYAVQEGRIRWEMLELCETPLQSLSPERW